jgi:uncharacterized protein (TIRG00374 family)
MDKRMHNLIFSVFAKQTLRWGLTVCLLIFFFNFLLHQYIWTLLNQMGGWPSIILAGTAILYLLETILSTKILLRSMGYRVRYSDLYLVWTASLPANYTTPSKVGIPFRLFLYKNRLNIPLSVGTASIALESIIGIGVVAAISAIGIFHLFQELESDFYVSLLIFLVLTVTVIFGHKYARPLLLHDRFANKYLERILRFGVNFRSSINQASLKAIMFFIFLLLIRLAIRVAATYFVLLQLDFEISAVTLLYVETISGLVGMVSMLPVGLGARELSFVFLLTRVGVQGNIAAFTAVITRIMWTLVPFLLGIISVNILGAKWVREGSISPEMRPEPLERPVE